jgi:transposase
MHSKPVEYIFEAEHRGTSYPRDVIDYALALLAMKKQYPNNRNLTHSAIARTVRVKSPVTIANWERMAMDDVSLYIRRMNKGHNRLFSESEELVIAGWALHQNKAHLPSTTRELMQFVEKKFEIRLSASWISKFLARQHLSHLKPSQMLYHENTDAHEKIVAWILYVRSILKNKSPDQVCHVDCLSIISFLTH